MYICPVFECFQLVVSDKSISIPADHERANLKIVKAELDHKESALSKAATNLKYSENEMVKQQASLARLREATELTRINAEEALHKYEDKLAAINALAKE